MARFSIASVVFSLALAASSVAAANIQVQVGKTGLTFEPQAVTNAQIGDTVTYFFHAKNHSVIQSSFAEPCKPLAGGFFSGFVPTNEPNGAASRTTFTITVKDNNPIWVYCGQTAGDHCQTGMVHSINAPTYGNNIGSFVIKAKAASKPSISPPDGLPVGGLRKTTIDVGQNGALLFTPNNITEPPRTVVDFIFNPKNHSVVQSSFKDPCHPSPNGFFSGFIPTTVSPSGADFQITVQDKTPIWFYCAQTVKTHCQAGMVGSINAPASGNTIDAFITLAKSASPSTNPPSGPLGGTLTVNGTAVNTLNGAVFDPNFSAPPSETTVPPPGATIPPDVATGAGGYQPAKYGWGPNLSDTATKLLQLINFVDNVLLDVLVFGHNNITTGNWKNAYPSTIKHTWGSMKSQAIVQRSTSTDSLAHYKKPLMGTCEYSYPIQNVNDFVAVALRLILLEVALFLDIIGTVANSDTWMLGPLSSTLGAKSRMAGMVNMMQNHIPAAAPREVMIPADLVYSYVSNHYVKAGSCKPEDTPPFLALPPLTITPGPMDAGRVKSVTLGFPNGQGTLFMAWLGPWGAIEYTPVNTDGQASGKGTADVPADLSGHVWGVLTNTTGASAADLPKVSVAGPEILWVTQPPA